MPNRDGTGPNWQWPLTGRGMWNCKIDNQTNIATNIQWRGLGFWRGFWMGKWNWVGRWFWKGRWSWMGRGRGFNF